MLGVLTITSDMFFSPWQLSLEPRHGCHATNSSINFRLASRTKLFLPVKSVSISIDLFPFANRFFFLLDKMINQEMRHQQQKTTNLSTCRTFLSDYCRYNEWAGKSETKRIFSAFDVLCLAIVIIGVDRKLLLLWWALVRLKLLKILAIVRMVRLCLEHFLFETAL